MPSLRSYSIPSGRPSILLTQASLEDDETNANEQSIAASMSSCSSLTENSSSLHNFEYHIPYSTTTSCFADYSRKRPRDKCSSSRNSLYRTFSSPPKNKRKASSQLENIENSKIYKKRSCRHFRTIPSSPNSLKKQISLFNRRQEILSKVVDTWVSDPQSQSPLSFGSGCSGQRI